MAKIYIFGEAHSSPESVAYIEKRIREIKPKIIMHELLYDDMCMTPEVIKDRLSKCKPGGKCDPNLNRDIYQLGLDIGAKLIGIDTEVPYRTLKEQFHIREAHMVKLIEQYMYNPGPIVVVVGDIHLRGHFNADLGKPSIIGTRLGHLTTIDRVSPELREAE